MSRAIIVYESKYGNTKLAAEKIVEGLKIREIAEVLGCSDANAKIRLQRAREKLRATLNRACDFTYDERNVFICERKAQDEGCGGTDCGG